MVQAGSLAVLREVLVALTVLARKAKLPTALSATSAAPTPGASGSATGSASASSSAKATDYRATIAGAEKSQVAAAKQGDSGIVTALWVVGALVVASAAGLGFLLLKRRKQEAAGAEASEA